MTAEQSLERLATEKAGEGVKHEQEKQMLLLEMNDEIKSQKCPWNGPPFSVARDCKLLRLPLLSAEELKVHDRVELFEIFGFDTEIEETVIGSKDKERVRNDEEGKEGAANLQRSAKASLHVDLGPINAS